MPPSSIISIRYFLPLFPRAKILSVFALAAAIADKDFPSNILGEAIREARQDHKDKIKETIKRWEVQVDFDDDGTKFIAICINSNAVHLADEANEQWIPIRARCLRYDAWDY